MEKVEKFLGIKNLYSPENFRYVHYLEESLKLLSSKVRLKILFILNEKPHCVCDLITHLDLPQTLVSYHLDELRQAGFVESERNGKFIDYKLSKKAQNFICFLKEIL